MFQAQIPDTVWKDVSCPVLLMAAAYLLFKALTGINTTMQAVKTAIERMPPPAQLPAPPPPFPPSPSKN